MATVLITGGGSGIGYRAVEAFLQAGHEVYTTIHHQNPYDETIPHLTVIPIDLNDRSMYHLLPEKIDTLVLNAGVLYDGLSEHMSESDITTMVQTNLTSQILLANHYLPYLKQQRKGKLIFMSSLAGRRALPNLSVYNATKHGIEGYANSLMLELAPFGVEVYLIEPGFYMTQLWRHQKEVDDPYEKKLQALSKRLSSARNINEVIVALVKIQSGKIKRHHVTFGIFGFIQRYSGPLLASRMAQRLFGYYIHHF